MTGPVDTDYLDSLYASGPDPWRLGNSFYESRKRELLLACLPARRYRAGYEPGCATGELTVALAGRCESLLASDYHAEAVRIAAERTAKAPNVEVRRSLLPDEWPIAQRFDLIVLSELGYYFAPDAWTKLCSHVAGSAADALTVAACHWRHDFHERRQPTRQLHDQLGTALGLSPSIQVLEGDFLIDVWTTDQLSPAQREGRR
jgi:SAM-dependent methyltransferase